MQIQCTWGAAARTRIIHTRNMHVVGSAAAGVQATCVCRVPCAIVPLCHCAIVPCAIVPLCHCAIVQVERCRAIYGKYLQWSSANASAWISFAELEASLGELERCRAIYDLAISQA